MTRRITCSKCGYEGYAYDFGQDLDTNEFRCPNCLKWFKHLECC